jgi:hypothetical protein
MMYARANELPPGIVRQKSLVEDIYDRLVCDSVLGKIAAKTKSRLDNLHLGQERLCVCLLCA